MRERATKRGIGGGGVGESFVRRAVRPSGGDAGKDTPPRRRGAAALFGVSVCWSLGEIQCEVVQAYIGWYRLVKSKVKYGFVGMPCTCLLGCWAWRKKIGVDIDRCFDEYNLCKSEVIIS